MQDRGTMEGKYLKIIDKFIIRTPALVHSRNSALPNQLRISFPMIVN